MKLSKWAKLKGVHYGTAYRWATTGKNIPNVKFVRLGTGTILVEETNIVNNKDQKVVIYARVSSFDRKKSLQNQIDVCEQYCLSKGYSIEKIYKEIASGMNDKRKILWKMIESNPTIIVIENKDRLTRFGFLYLKNLLSKLGIEIEVLNQDHEDEKDLIKDMISIITSFCCRLYGLRRGKNKAKELKEKVLNDHLQIQN